MHSTDPQFTPSFPNMKFNAWQAVSYLSVHERVEDSDHKTLVEEIKEKYANCIVFAIILSLCVALFASHVHMIYLCGWQSQLNKGPYLKH